MRTAIALVALALLSGAARAETVTVDRIDVVDQGIYVVETGAATPDPSAPTGQITAVTGAGARNIEATSSIEARIGLEFGLRYIVVGEPEGTEVTLDIVITYPPQGLRDPEATETVRESRYQRTKRIGETAYLGYGFENDWEIEPGLWTFEIWLDNRKLAERSFTVTR